MANFNKVILMGNLTRDPQLSYLPSNTPVCSFGLAVNRRYKGNDGEMKDETCFVDVDAFGRQAETINQYMSKGRAILIEGRLRFRQWTTDDGQKRSKLSVVAEAFQFVGGRGDDPGLPARAGAGAAVPESDSGPAPDDDIPF